MIKFFFLVILLALLGCQFNTSNIHGIDQEDSDQIEISQDEFNLSSIEGIWRSYSYYLEHEEQDVDEHINEYYKIINSNYCIDLIFKNHDLDSLEINTYRLGFTNKTNIHSKWKTSLSNGEGFIRDHEGSYDGISERIFTSKGDTSWNYSLLFDTYKIMDDGFLYCYKTGIQERVQFKEISALPEHVFVKLKVFSSYNGVKSYMREVNISELSLKAVVRSTKVMVYEDVELLTATDYFLQEKDIVYIESLGDSSARVYMTTVPNIAGYVKLNELHLID
ncbi:MAG: hypothetical protein HWE22_02910 [Flavobacteriales bacterium]|nr:hypothetical protein [Flavobacteriales bacterium]